MLQWFSSIIEAIDQAGLSGLFYNIFFFGGFVGLTIYNISVARNYGLSILKAIILTVLVYAASVGWMFVLFWIFTGRWGGNNIVRIFIWVPVFALPVAMLLKIKWLTACDFISPCLCINHGIAHLGCIFAGCCHSFRWDNGVFNPQLHYKTFPIQPIEAIVAIFIAVFIAIREKRKNYQTDGLSIPIMLMMFGYSRFLLEFARDNEKLFWNISELALHALLAGIVGTVSYFIVKKYNQKKAALAEPAM
ncbi:MAG: prolipoprotein diacylglyceryl transferase [Lachnospiraceae bacterium]|nr:prolipoprotein diacylglyceryl transferase [Lachnospiraceae bacterium]